MQIARSRRGVKLTEAGLLALPVSEQRRILRNRKSAERARAGRRARLAALESQHSLLLQTIARKEAQLMFARQCMGTTEHVFLAA